MAKYSSSVHYDIKTTLDASGIAQLQAEIRKTENAIQSLAYRDLITERQANNAMAEIKKLQDAINSSFNSSLGMLDMNKLSASLRSGQTSLGQLQKAFSAAGSTGEKAFNDTIARLGKFDTGLKSTSSTIDKMFTTISNTVRWGVVSRGFNSVTDLIRQSVDYMKDLDDSLTQIMLVTDYSRNSMNEYAKSANEAAKALGSTTTAMTNASLIFAQQGFNLEQSDQLAQLSTKLANASQQDTATTSDQITAYMNAYGLDSNLEELSGALDAWALVANVSAADVSELAEASQRAASTASTLGVTMDQLNAQIATIESVTREAPEQIGNSLKTLYARFSDISLGETLEDGVDLGEVTKQLQKIGVEALDGDGTLRNVGDIMEDLMDVWGELNTTQKAATSQVLAGKYQLTRFQALMNRSDLYDQYKEASEGADGTLDMMNDKYVDSLAGRMNKLQASLEGVYNSAFNTDSFYGFLDALSVALELVSDLIESIGGGGQALLAFGSIAARVFSKQLAANINNVYQNMQVNRSTKESRQNAYSQLEAMGVNDVRNERNAPLVDLVMGANKNSNVMTQQQWEEVNRTIDTTKALVNEVVAAEQDMKDTVSATNLIYQILNKSKQKFVDIDEQGNLVNEEGMNYVLSRGQDYTDLTNLSSAQEKKAVRGVKGAVSQARGVQGALFNIGNQARLYSETTNEQDMKESLITFNHLMGESDDAVRKFISSVTRIPLKELDKEFSQLAIDDRLPFDLRELSAAYNEVVNLSGFETENQEVEKFRDNIDIVTSKLGELIARYQSLLDNGFANTAITDPEDYARLQNRKTTAEVNLDSQNGAITDLVGGFDRQSQIQDVITLSSSVGELAFAWQSFQSLGSLMVNSDLDETERLVQIIANLAMTIPQLISAWSSFQSLAKSGTFSQFATSAENWAANIKTSSSAFPILGTAAEGAAAGVGILSTAINALAGPLGIVVSILATVVPMAIGAFTQSQEEAAEAIRSAGEAANESIASVQSAQDNFESLYDSYQRGEASSDELKAAAEALNDIIDNQAAKTYAAAGMWDNYAESVKNAAIEEAKANLGQSIALMQQSASDYEEASGGSPWSKAQALKYGDYGVQEAYDSATAIRASNLSTGAMEFRSDASAEERIESYEILSSRLTDAIEQAKEEYERVSESFDEGSSEVINAKRAVDYYTNALTTLQSAYATGADKLSTYTTNRDTALNNFILANQNNESIQYTDGESIEDYKARIEPILEAQGFDVTDSFMDSFVDGMSQYDTSSSQALAQQLGLENTEEVFRNNFSDKLSNSMSSAGISSSSLGIDDSSQYYSQVSDMMYDQIANSGLTADEQIKFIAGIDWSKSLAEIQDDINNINVSDELPALSFQAETKFTDRSSFSDEQITELLDETDMSQSGFDRMTSDMFDSGAIGEQAESIRSQIEAIKDSGDESEEAQEKIADLRQEYEDLGDTTKDIAAYNLQMNKGLSKLTDLWEDYSDVLEDDAAKGTSDYYEAIGQLDEAVSEMLNIDPGVLSNGFYENADALDAMERAANGDASAIDDLRNIASQDIIMNLDVQGISAEDKDYLINNELLPMLTELQSNLDTMPLGASVDVDTDNFIQKLNELLELGQITATQASTILSSIGMDAEIETVSSGPVTQSHSAYFPRFRVEKDENGIMTAIVPDGMEEATWETTETVEFPKITGAAYTGSGVSTVGSRSGGGKKGSGKGSGGGGGGGSGSGSSYKPKDNKSSDDEIDRYERVNTMLEAIGNDYEKISNEQDRLTGKEVADNMAEQIKLLQRQIELYKEKLEIQTQEAREVRDQLASEYGITFDSEGFMTNYMQTHQALIDEVNRIGSQYSSLGSEEAEEALDDQYEAAEKRLEDFKELYERYDELWSSEMKDSIQQLEDLEDAIEDLRIEAFNTAVEALDNIKDIQDALIEFNHNMHRQGVEDDPFDAAGDSLLRLQNYFDVAAQSADDFYDELIAKQQEFMNNATTETAKQYYQEQIDLLRLAKASADNQTMEQYGTGYLDMSMKNVADIVAQIQQYEQTGSSGIFGENSSALYDAAKDVFDQATGLIDDYWSELEELHDNIMDMIDDIAERMEDRREQYELINEELEHQLDIVELIKGENAYDELNQVLDAQQQNYQAQISEYRQQIQIWKELQSSMIEGSEQWKEIQEQITDATSEMNDLLQDSLENLQEQYSNTVSKITDSWSSSAMGNDLDWIQTEWELINRNADYYLDDVNKAYNIQKLQAQYLELLDGSNDLSIQQQITAQMQEQLGYLRDKTNLSEYDVQYAQAQLEILQRRIALEEAQKNKSQMKLRRDSQGNYSYVYTANEGDVSSAQSDLLDAQNNAYNLSKNQMQQTQADSLSALTDAKSMIDQIWNDANLSLDEKKKRTETIINSLKEYLAATSEQLSTSEQNIINDFIGMCEILTEENSEGLQDVYDQIIQGNTDAFDQIDTRWQTSITGWLQNLETFNKETDKMYGDLEDNLKDFQTNVEALQNVIGKEFTNIGDSIKNCVDQTNALKQSQKEFSEQLTNDVGAIQDYESKLQEYTNKITDAQNAMKAYQAQVNELASKLTAKEQENATLNSRVEELQNKIDEMSRPSSSGGGGGSGSGGGGGGGGGGGVSAGSYVGYRGRYYHTSWGGGPSGNLFSGRSGAVKIDWIQSSGAGGYNVHISSPKNGYSDLGWVSRSQLFDSGGYTGTWNDGNPDAKNGKLAYLHQKELVLNASDTENILDVVKTVREMVSVVKSGASQGLGLGIASMVSGISAGTQRVDQNVTITAEFPNATSANEIEQAILSLNERAIQYSFSK